MTETVDRILIAEDDLASRRLLEVTLGSSGYDVVSTANGTQAWEEIQRDGAPALALLDVMMPGMDGFELTRRIRSDLDRPYVYVIILTARGFKDDIIQGYEAGADDYIVKPFEPEELKARIRVGKRILALEEKMALIQHDRAVLKMAATLGHEINNPLASMLPALELLRYDFNHPEEMDRGKIIRRLDSIEVSANRISEVVERFITMAKVRTKDYLSETDMLDLSVEDDGPSGG